MIARLDAELLAYAQHGDFARLERMIRADVAKLARNLRARWRVPSAVSDEDVAQELMLRIWAATARWRPGGMPFDRYVVWCAVRGAERWIHEQRQARKRSARARSRIEQPSSHVFVDDCGPEDVRESAAAAAWRTARVQEPAGPIAVALREAIDAAIRACASPRERRAVEALLREGFDVGRASRRLPRRLVVKKSRELKERMAA